MVVLVRVKENDIPAMEVALIARQVEEPSQRMLNPDPGSPCSCASTGMAQAGDIRRAFEPLAPDGARVRTAEQPTFIGAPVHDASLLECCASATSPSHAESDVYRVSVSNLPGEAVDLVVARSISLLLLEVEPSPHSAEFRTIRKTDRRK